MRVLYYHQFFSTRDGSSGTRSYELAKELVKRGHEVTMVCASSSNTGLDGPMVKGQRSGVVDGIHVIEFDLSYSNAMSLPRRAMVFMKFTLRSGGRALRQDYDLLFATSAPLTVAIPGILMKRLPGKKRPFVFEIRDPWPEVPRAMGLITNRHILRALEWLETTAYRAADAHIGLSPGMLDAFTAKGVRKETVHLVPNGADNDLFRPATRKGIDLPGLEPDDFVAVFCGAHGMANGLDVVVEAGIELKKAGNSKVKLILIGDGKVKSTLQKRVEEAGLQNVLFFPPMPKRKLADLLPHADAGLMILADVPTFRYGSSPNKFFDYLASGLPVVVNHPGWVSDLCLQHQCGITTAPKDGAMLARTLIDLTKDPAWLATMAKNARRLAESDFDRASLAERFVDIIERTADEWAAGRKSG